MQHIQQRAYYDCGIACLAMITGLDYDAIKAEFVNFDNGLTDFQMMAFLAEHGFACAMKYPFYIPANEKRPERLKPFTNWHFALVDNRHFVIVLGNGLVLDPALLDPTHIEDYNIGYICGVVPYNKLEK